MSKLSNELLMIQLLSNGRKYSIKELSNILEVSERMVRCYKEEIEKSGIIIETIRGIYGGYILKNDYLIPKMKFNDYEYKFLSNIKCSNENKKLLDEILIKVKSMSNCNDTKHIVSSEIKNYYNILNKAIREHRKVFVKYESYSEGIGDRIIARLDASEKSAMQDKINALQTQLTTEHQSGVIAQQIAAAVNPIAQAVNEIKCAQPQTVTVPYQPFQAIPNCVAYQYGMYNGGNNFNGFWF